MKSGFLKYEIRKFTFDHMKGLTRKRKQNITNLESGLKKTRN